MTLDIRHLTDDGKAEQLGACGAENVGEVTSASLQGSLLPGRSWRSDMTTVIPQGRSGGVS